MTEKKVTQVTFTDAFHIMPEVSGGRIVWEDSRNTPAGQLIWDLDIYMYDPPGSILPSPSPSPSPLPSPSPSPSPPPTPQTDSDKDGYSDAVELYIGTNPNLKCGINAWPPDFNSDRIVDISDVNLLSPPVLNSRLGDASYKKRYDLNADGTIDALDVNKLAPPIFFSTCTP